MPAQEHEINACLQEIAKTVDGIFKEKIGETVAFAVIATPAGGKEEDAFASYVSNADRRDMLALVRDWIQSLTDRERRPGSSSGGVAQG